MNEVQKMNDTKMEYMELPLVVFRHAFPEIAEMLPKVLRITNDPRYIVRFCPERGTLEVGYREDNWSVLK